MGKKATKPTNQNKDKNHTENNKISTDCNGSGLLHFLFFSCLGMMTEESA